MNSVAAGAWVIASNKTCCIYFCVFKGMHQASGCKGPASTSQQMQQCCSTHTWHASCWPTQQHLALACYESVNTMHLVTHNIDIIPCRLAVLCFLLCLSPLPCCALLQPA
jgi:hypothetical protein